MANCKFSISARNYFDEIISTDNYMFKVNNRYARIRCEICSKLWTYFTPCSSVFIVNFEYVTACWDNTISTVRPHKLTEIINSSNLLSNFQSDYYKQCLWGNIDIVKQEEWKWVNTYLKDCNLTTWAWER